MVRRELVHVERHHARREPGGGEDGGGAEERPRPQCPHGNQSYYGEELYNRHVLRVLLIKPLMAAGHERPSAVSFLRGLAARSVFLLAATVGLNLLIDPLGVYGSRLFEPIVLRTRGAKLYLYEQTRPAPAIVILGSSRSFSVDPQYVEAKTSRKAFNAAVNLYEQVDFEKAIE